MANSPSKTLTLSQIMDDVTAKSGYLQIHQLGKQVAIMDVINAYHGKVSKFGEDAFDEGGFITLPAVDMEGGKTSLRAKSEGFEALFTASMEYFDRGVAANGPQIKPTEAWDLSQRAIG